MKASRRGILSYFNGSNECICIRDQMQVGSDIKNSTIVENSELVKVLRKNKLRLEVAWVVWWNMQLCIEKFCEYQS